MRTYDKPIKIQRLTEAEEWEDLYNLHAYVNKPRDDNEYTESGSTRTRRALTFEVRYFKDLERLSLNTQFYRILYRGIPYNITGYDDYQERHISVKINGESY